MNLTKKEKKAINKVLNNSIKFWEKHIDHMRNNPLYPKGSVRNGNAIVSRLKKEKHKINKY